VLRRMRAAANAAANWPRSWTNPAIQLCGVQVIRLQLKSPRRDFGFAKIARRNPWLRNKTCPAGAESAHFSKREFSFGISPLGAQIFDLDRLIQSGNLQRRL